jgi:hypothetical protein
MAVATGKTKTAAPAAAEVATIMTSAKTILTGFGIDVKGNAALKKCWDQTEEYAGTKKRTPNQAAKFFLGKLGETLSG